MNERANTLDVSIGGVHCGVLEQNAHGELSFSYDLGYRGIPLSLSMPVGVARYTGSVVRTYLMGLLPDNENTRATIAASFGVSGENPFRMLEHMGMDCPGAVQFCHADRPAMPFWEQGGLLELTDRAIAVKLAGLKENSAAAWVDAPLQAGHWSLGGCQAKLALRFKNGSWYECTGSQATTHILKPGVAGLEGQALVEYISMKLARRIGLPAAEVDYREFDGEPALVIARYDRITNTDATITRLHQEDLCQALSVSPLKKYADQGGPSTPQIIELLKRTGPYARNNVYQFILYLFFNYLIGATDGHAKNHSIVFTGPNEIRLAPLYDVASMAPYKSLRPTQRKPPRAALSIGGENRFGNVGIEHVAKMVRTCRLEDIGLDTALLVDRLATMARMIPNALADILAEASETEHRGLAAIATGMTTEIGGICARTVQTLPGAKTR